jgi:hypothetical protein
MVGNAGQGIPSALDAVPNEAVIPAPNLHLLARSQGVRLGHYAALPACNAAGAGASQPDPEYHNERAPNGARPGKHNSLSAAELLRLWLRGVAQP